MWYKGIYKQIDFTKSWSFTFLTGATLGAVLVAIMIFLQPFDTYTYQSPTKNLELAGYAPVIILSVLLLHLLELALYRWQAQSWRLWQEALSLFLGSVLLLGTAYLYNAWGINGVEVRFRFWWYWILSHGMPFLVFLLPFWAMLRIQFARLEQKRAQQQSREVQLTLVGENKSEQVQLKAEDFLYAQSQQNYVDIYFSVGEGEQIEKKMLRSTLSRLQQQLPQAQQVHRSYLVNPTAIDKVEGNARKRLLYLKRLTDPLPLSANYYEAVKRQLSDSSP